MKILIVSATTLEIAPLLNELGVAPNLNHGLHKVHSINSQIDILITGVGILFTGYYLGQALSSETYDIAINTGVAGAIDRELELGEVVHVCTDFIYELGAEDQEQFLSLSNLHLLSEKDHPYTNLGINNSSPAVIPLLETLKQVDGHTVNKVHGCVGSITVMKTRSKAQVETMEGAAFLYACIKNNLPCVQIRAISNYVEPRNKNAWKISLAISSLNNFLIQCLKKI